MKKTTLFLLATTMFAAASAHAQTMVFSEDFSTTSGLSRFDKGWAGEWNAGALFGGAVNDWHGDHSMACENPNTSNRTIHLTSQQQANDAAFYICIPDGDPTKGHMMTSVNTEGYVTVWFSPKQVFKDVTKVCWDQNVTDLGGGKWVIVNWLIPSEFTGQTDLGYTSPDFPNTPNTPSSPQGSAKNGVKVFKGGMRTYTNGVMNDQPAVGELSSDKAARLQHCVADNGNGTLTTSIAQLNGTTMTHVVPGSIPRGDVRVEFADDNYNNDKHFDAAGVPTNSTGLYTWHWDNIQVFAGGGGGNTPVNGACGSANNVPVSAAPTTNLCNAGNASAVAGSGPWTWTCAGTSGGTTASCSAPKTTSGGGATNGACGTANGTTSATKPTALCASGTAKGPWSWSGGNAAGVALGPWSWDCAGINGGTSAKCSAAQPDAATMNVPTDRKPVERN